MYKTNFIILIVFITLTYGRVDIVEKVASNVYLKCLTNNTFPVKWMKSTLDDRVFELTYGNDERINSFVSRVVLKPNRRDIIIQNVKFQDAGTYSCINLNSDDLNINQSTRLTVTDSILECTHNIKDRGFYVNDILNVSCMIHYNGLGLIDTKCSSNIQDVIRYTDYYENNHKLINISSLISSRLNNTSLTCTALNDNLRWTSPIITVNDPEKPNYDMIFNYIPNIVISLIITVLIVVTILHCLCIMIIHRHIRKCSSKKKIFMPIR